MPKTQNGGVQYHHGKVAIRESIVYMGLSTPTVLTIHWEFWREFPMGELMLLEPQRLRGAL